MSSERCEFVIRTGKEPTCTHDCPGCMFYNDPELIGKEHGDDTFEGVES